MAKRLQHRGGTTSQHSTFTGAVREVTVDTDKNTLVVHDGATAGGHPLATATNFTSTGIDDNATSTAITIDSSENVGIGTSSPDDKLHVNSGTENDVAKFESTDTRASLILVDNATTTDGNRIQTIGDTMNFQTGGSEAMRIDSARNLLVGKTSADIATVGVEAIPQGRIGATRSGNITGLFNRLSSDGEIVRFQKDGTTVGSIGAEGDDLLIGTGNTGIRFYDLVGQLLPRTTSGGASNNAIDLGSSVSNFRDLYLGGGLYVGGTGTANKLDDYEEGTWTPNFSNGITSLGYSSRSGSYVKIGTTVFFHLQMVTNAGFGAATRLKIGGLPFTASTSGGSGIANINYADNGFINSTSTNFPSLFFEPSSIDFYKTDGTDFQGAELADPDSLNIYIGGVYRTG